jgi:signal transduction histidine kinase
VVIALGLLSVGNYFGYYQALKSNLSSNIRSSISQTSQLLNTAVSAASNSPQGNMRTVETFFREMLSREGSSGVVYVVVKRHDGVRVLDAGTHADVLPEPDRPQDYEASAENGIVHVNDAILLGGNEVGELQYGLATLSTMSTLTQGYKNSLALTTAVSLLIFALLAIVGLNITRRVSRLSRASDAIAMGNYHMRVEVSGRDELSGLSGNFNRMADAIERKIHEISDLNEVLELRVRQRTEALQISNQLLEDNVAQLSSAKEQLVRTEKLASLGALVAGVAHEMNTPIGNALGATTTVHQKAVEFAMQASSGTVSRKGLTKFVQLCVEGSELAERSLTRAASLISNFKQVAVDQSSEQRRPFDLAQTVEEVASTFSYTLKKVPQEFVYDIPSGILLDSYPGPFRQVIANLLNNALMHAFEGRSDGHIRLRAALASPSRAILEFSDDGCGISPANLKRIFDPFFTTRLGQGGSGLGMSIVHNIVERLLGGSIRVESMAGTGTLFIIDLPLTAPDGAP